jgi:hypothetical protein
VPVAYLGTIDYISRTGELKSKYQFTVFAAYLALMAFAVANHEPWMDEAQAWLIAQEATIPELFTTYLRYEGAGGLWHLILLPFAKAGFPYITLNIVAAAISAIGVLFFLRYSPFPPLIKILLPFTYFAFYQYGVVARSYCLVPLLMFTAAHFYQERMERPIRLVVPLCLLSFVSAHTFLVAAGICFIYFIDVVMAWRELDSSRRLDHAIALAVFGLASVLVILILLPPSDHILNDPIDPHPMRFIGTLEWAVPGSLVLDEASSFRTVGKLLSFAILGVTLVWLRRRGFSRAYIVPAFILLSVFALKYRSLWHDGILFFVWVTAIWIAWRRSPSTSTLRFERTFALAACYVIVVQCIWSIMAVKNDFRYDYSGSRAAAEYIRSNVSPDDRIFATGWKTTALLPYLHGNPFYNYNEGSTERRSYDWSMSNASPRGATPYVVWMIEEQQPDVVLIASDHVDPEELPSPEGYRVAATFHGYLFWKTGTYELNSYWIYRKLDN